jgi:hypothetical protein
MFLASAKLKQKGFYFILFLFVLFSFIILFYLRVRPGYVVQSGLELDKSPRLVLNL